MSHANNFGLIRFVLASLVIYSHCYPLSGNGTDPVARSAFRGQSTLGAMSVEFFFAISGLLITASWFKSRDAADYLRKRMYRIYPGFVAAYVIGLAVALVCASDARQLIKDCIYNSGETLRDVVLLQSTAVNTPRVFPSNAEHLVNGAMWTIQIEFVCYMIVMGLGVLGLLRYRWFVAGAFIAFFGCYMFRTAALHTRADSYVRFLTFFLGGSLGYHFQTLFRVSVPRIIGALAIVGVGVAIPPLFKCAVASGGVYLLMAIAFSPWLKLHWFGAKNDLSYGLYLYGWPITQFVIARFGVHQPLTLFALVYPLCLGAALASWLLVERRFVRRRSIPLVSTTTRTHSLSPSSSDLTRPEPAEEGTPIPSPLTLSAAPAQSTDRIAHSAG